MKGPKLDQKFGRGFNSVTIVTNFNVFLYSACRFIEAGALPIVTKRFGGGPIMIGQLQTTFALSELAGKLFYGRLGDVLGERIAFILAFGAAVLSSAMLGITSSIQLLFLSRFFSVFIHVFQVSQMYISRISSEAKRTSDLSQLNALNDMGMVIGSSVGGIVTSMFGERSSALLASFGSFISMVLVIIYIPNIPRKSNSEEPHSSKSALKRLNSSGSKDNVSPLSIFNITEIFNILSLPQVAVLLLMKLACGIPNIMLNSMISVIIMDHCGISADYTGLVLTYIGCIGMLTQGFGISFITSRYSEQKVFRFSVISLGISFAGLLLVRNATEFLIILLPITCFSVLLRCLITGYLTKVVPSSYTGQVLGINLTATSLIFTISPALGGYLISLYGFTSLGSIGTFLIFIAFLMLPPIDQ